MKTEISICTGLMLNDHSNPYIESTTVLSDDIILLYMYITKYGCVSLKLGESTSESRPSQRASRC